MLKIGWTGQLNKSSTSLIQVQEKAGIMKERVIGRRPKNYQSGRIGQPNSQVLVDRIVQKLSAAASILSAAVPDVVDQFPVSCQDDLQHSYFVFRAFRVYF